MITRTSYSFIQAQTLLPPNAEHQEASASAHRAQGPVATITRTSFPTLTTQNTRDEFVVEQHPPVRSTHALVITRTSFSTPTTRSTSFVVPVSKESGEQHLPTRSTYALTITRTSFLTTTARNTVAPPRTEAQSTLAQLPTFQVMRKLPSTERLLMLVTHYLLLLIIVSPLLFTVLFGLGALQTYIVARADAQSGYQHFQAVETLFKNTHSNSMLDTQKLSQARADFTAARTEMIQAQQTLKNSAFVQAVQQYLPVYSPQIQSAIAACQIGIDAADIGQQVTGAAITLAPRLSGSLLNNSKTPLITQSDVTLLQNTLNTTLNSLQDIQRQSSHMSLDALPFNDHQKTQIKQLLGYLPQAQKGVTLAQSLLTSANWLFGIGQPRTFLIQTLDSSELRATGGFTGQYGELTISGGRVAPFSLHDVGQLEDYSPTDPTVGSLAPQVYRSWWPFANWGLRDSNLSADYPTSAQLAIQRYEAETHNHIDGDISFTPVLIQDVLQVIGPISIPQYGETITAQNLQDRLHYYQLDNNGIRKEEIVEGVSDPTQARKLFTNRLAQALMQHIRQASPQTLLALGKQFLSDIKTKDLQIYVTNPQVESQLEKYSYAAQMNRSTSYDGLYIVQMNLSASKASQYVTTSVNDSVQLDADGGALHQLQMRLVYDQQGPVYGLDTYRDYIRFYVPPSAQFLSGDGFDSGNPLCGGIMGACEATDVYSHNELVCPEGGYDAGAAAPMLNDPYMGEYHPLDTIGPPTNFTSDEPDRSMFGGWVVIPKNCTATITLSWYVPAVTQGAPYALLVQHQASTTPQFTLDVQPASNTCPDGKALVVNNELKQDTAFTLERSQSSSNTTDACTLHVTTS
ncbi:MAG TPA: DUF4012 domain-containing protein [Ktedonobacteraceae bacterium]